MNTIMTVALIMTIVVASAQDTKSYWVVESTSTKNESIVKIYDVNHNLVKEQNIARRIDITKKKERRRLDKLTRQSSGLLWSKR